MPGLLSNLMGSASQKMDNPQAPGPPNGGPPSPVGPLQPGLQAHNTGSGLMQMLSGLFGGGNPQQDQSNAYVKGQVDQYMKQKQAAQAAAAKTAQNSGQRTLKKLMQNAPQPNTPMGTTPPPIPFQGNVQGQ